MEVDRYLTSRREGSPDRIVLEEPRFSRPYAFLSVAMLEVLRYVCDTEQTPSRFPEMTPIAAFIYPFAILKLCGNVQPNRGIVQRQDCPDNAILGLTSQERSVKVR